MANPSGQVVLGEEDARATEACYAEIQVQLQALRQQNEELQCALQEQQEIAVTERLRGNRRSRDQMQEYTNLTVELLARRRGPEVQWDGMRIGVKVEKPETHSGEKGRDLDTWLFQVRGHLNIISIPERGHVQYAALLLRGNAALWWRETCEANRRPATGMSFAMFCASGSSLKITVVAVETSWQKSGSITEKL